MPTNPEMDVQFTARNDYSIILQTLKEAFDRRWHNVKPSPTTGLSGYQTRTILGAGSFGKVFLIKDGVFYYAAKQMGKEEIVRTKQVKHVYNEKRVLHSVRFPFCVHLIASTKDFDNIYLIMPFISGGELFNYHRKVRKFSEKQARFYAAQVYLSLEYLHYCNILYRDLKPENIMIDTKGYLKITDFGFAKLVEGRTQTLCGTPEYLPPEIIQSKPYGRSADWWAFGVLIYELVAGYSPFSPHSKDTMLMYKKICDGEYKIPMHFTAPLTNLVSNLLQVDITKRCGCQVNGPIDIKEDEWMKSTDWIAILNRSITAPYVPEVSSAEDLSNFNTRTRNQKKTASRGLTRDSLFDEF